MKRRTTKFGDVLLWQMTDSGGEPGNGPKRRTWVTAPWMHEFDRQFFPCTPIENWDANIYVNVDAEGPDDIEDVLLQISPGNYHFVNDRVREVVEFSCPGHAQFLPVQLRRNRPGWRPPGQYWLMHWLRLVDCFDREKSDWEQLERGIMMRYDGLVIDMTKIPEQVLGCRMVHRKMKLLVRPLVRDAFIAANIRGMYFIPMRTSPSGWNPPRDTIWQPVPGL